MSDIVPLDGNKGLTAEVLTPERIELLKRTVCRGSTDDEFQLFVSVANRAGLDPFSRQIHAVKRGGQMTIQTGIDGYRLIAQRSGQYGGQDDIVYDTEEGQHPNKATCTVYRFVNGQRVGTTKTARWREYAQDNGPMWRKMPWAMLGKCAEALALRAAFPQELSGLYTNEEMDQAESRVTVALSAGRVEAQPVDFDVVPTRTATPDESAPIDDLPDAAQANVLDELLGLCETGSAEIVRAAERLGIKGAALAGCKADPARFLRAMTPERLRRIHAEAFAGAPKS
jgi:phage recombination protein Bet